MIKEDFYRFIRWSLLWFLIFFGSMFLIGYVDAKGEEIDKGINTMLYGNNK